MRIKLFEEYNGHPDFSKFNQISDHEFGDAMDQKWLKLTDYEYNRISNKRQSIEFKLMMYSLSNCIVDRISYKNLHLPFRTYRDKPIRCQTLRKLYGRHLF